MFGLSLTGICIFVWNSIPIHIMYFMSISVKHLLPNVCYKFYQANDKKKLNLIQACLWRLLHEEISDLDHFIINQIACSPFETRKLRWLIWGRSNVIEILMSFLYLGISNFCQLRYYFFQSRPNLINITLMCTLNSCQMDWAIFKKKQSVIFITSFS